MKVLRNALTLLIAVATACAPAGSKDQPTASSAVQPAGLSLRGVAANRTTISAGAALVGRLESYERATLATRMSGTITELRVDVGDRVKSGQVLAVLSVPGLSAQAQAAVASSEVARHETAMRADVATRAGTIAERNGAAISQQEVLAAQNAVAVAEARVGSTVAEARRLRELLNDTRLVAPFDGVVVARAKDRGTSVEAGDIVLEIARMDPLRVRLNVPETLVGLVRNGAPLTLTIPSLDAKTIETTLTRFSPSLGTQTRMLPIEVDLPNPDGALVAGVRVEARFAEQLREGVLVVPSEALLREGAESVLYVAAEGLAQRRVVRVGHDSGLVVEITEGVVEGDVVLLGGRGMLRDGVAVEVAL